MLESLDLVDLMLESVTLLQRKNRVRPVLVETAPEPTGQKGPTKIFICYDLFVIWDVIPQREVRQVLWLLFF